MHGHQARPHLPGKLCPCVPIHELDTLHCSDDNQKLWYAAMIAAIRYDNDHKFVLDCGEPNMQYSLIREFPDNFNGV